ncbi:MAG: calcium/sodium antiporter [Bacteroidota bacterium]
MEYLLLLLGFVLLAAAGNYLVESSVALSKHLKVSTLVIGVVVVSFGTSAPELIVSLKAALAGHSDIAIGNVVGSNIANIGLILGITAIILPIPVKSRSIIFDWPVMMIASILIFLFMLNNQIGRIEGFILFILLIMFVYYSLYSSRKNEKISNKIPEKAKYDIWISLLLLVLSCGGLYFGSELLVKNASSIALKFNVSERIISITIISFGTSVPELAASLAAALKKEMDISIGNIIGSNLFNILGILGITSLIHPIKGIDPQINSFDIFWMLGFSLLLFLLIIPIKKGILKRWKGLLLLSCYLVFLYFIFQIKK